MNDIQWPNVVTALLSLLPSLDGWRPVSVYDGPKLSDDVTRWYVTVGYADDVGSEDGGAWTRVRDPDGFQTQEAGEVICELTCQDDQGLPDLRGTRSEAFALLNTLAVRLAADQTLAGALSVNGTVDLDGRVRPRQSAVGAFVSLVFTIRYTTVT